jgi:hypothetical protein
MFNTGANETAPWAISKPESNRSLTWKFIIGKIVTHSTT